MVADTNALLALLVDVSIKALLIALVAGAGLAIFRIRDSNVRHRAWTCVLAAMLLLPALTLIAPRVAVPSRVYPTWQSGGSNLGAVQHVADPPLTAPATIMPVGPLVTERHVRSATQATQLPAANRDSNTNVPAPNARRAAAPERDVRPPWPPMSRAIRWSAVLLSGYAIGFTLFAARLLVAFHGARRLVASSQAVELAPDFARLVGKSRVRESTQVRVPLTVGWLCPTILLPGDWRNWDPVLVRGALTHEETHLRRRDQWVTLCAEWNRVIYWFHPLVWFLRRQLATLAERACDDNVIETLGDRAAYAEQLLLLAGRLAGKTRRLEPLALSMARTPRVERRIDAILDLGRPLTRRIGIRRAVALLGALVPLIVLAAGLKAQVPEAAPQRPTRGDKAAAKQVLPVLRGRITDERGAPVTDATIELTGSKPTTRRFLRNITTDAQGRYQLEQIDEPDDYRVRITSQRWVGVTDLDALERIPLAPESAVVRDFQLQRACQIRIQVVNESLEPISRASVYIASVAENSIGNLNRVSADREGYALLGGVPPSSTDYIIAAHHADYAFGKLVKKLDNADNLATAMIILSKGEAVTGKILCSDGLPASGWRVGALPEWWNFGAYPSGTEIAEDGTFTLNHVAADTYNVYVSVPTGEGRMTRHENPLPGVTLPSADGPLAIRLRVPSPHSMTEIRGRVRFVGTPPQNSISISAYSDSNEFSGGGRIERGGQEFRVSVPPGRHRLNFHSDEIEQKTVNNVIAPNDSLVVELAALERPVIRGRAVRKDTGEPLTKFRVKMVKKQWLRGANYVQDERWRTIENERGEFDIEVLQPAICEAIVAADGFAAGRSEPINTDVNKGQRVKIELGVGTLLSGTVVDEQGQPIDGAKVIPVTKSLQTSPRTGTPFVSGEGGVQTVAGRFAIDNLTPGKEYLKVTHPDYTFAILENIDIPAEGLALPPITLKVGGTIRGRVYDASGQPQANVRLHFQDDIHGHGRSFFPEGVLASVVTDRNGDYEVRGLPDQVCFVRRDDEWTQFGVVRHAILAESGRTHTLNLGGPSSVRGRVLINGTPLANVKLQLAAENPRFSLFKVFAQTASDGSFVFWGPPAGRWTLYYLIPGQRNGWVRVRDVQLTGGPMELGVIDESSTKLIVECQGLPPEALGKLTVSLEEYNPKWPFGNQVGAMAPLTKPGDPFVFNFVPPGKYELTAMPQPNSDQPTNRFTVRQLVEVSAGRPEQVVTFKIPTGTAVLRGRFESADESGRYNPPNLWSKDGRLLGSLYISADNVYEVSGLPAGEYYLTDADTRDAAPVVEFTLADGERKTIDITPDTFKPRPRRIGFLELHTYTNDGIPLPGCEITFSGAGEAPKLGSAQYGRLVYTGPAGEYNLTVSYPGFETLRRKVTLPAVSEQGRAQGDYEINLRLTPITR
jgi:beta-lactamase regulating signal transducer with metallopeptidase domain